MDIIDIGILFYIQTVASNSYQVASGAAYCISHPLMMELKHLLKYVQLVCVGWVWKKNVYVYMYVKQTDTYILYKQQIYFLHPPIYVMCTEKCGLLMVLYWTICIYLRSAIN